MDPFELAAKLRQVRTIQSELGSSEQVSRIGSVQVVSGVAESDSSGGYVMVNLGGSSVTQDGTQAVECASDVSVKAGQEVQVQIADGKPRVTGVIGWGDAIRADVDLAATQAADAETLATEAKEAVEAVSQHFWHDANGAHVSTEAGVADGARNSLWNSLGIFFRSAANYLVGITQSAVQFYDGLGNAAANIMASFGATGARIGYAAKAHVAIDADSVDFNDGTKTLASVVNSDGMAGIVIPNSGAVVGGTTSEPALWIKSTNANGRIAIGSGHGKPTGEEIQITEGRVYMPSGMSPAAISFGLGGTAATSGTIFAEGRITGVGLTSNDANANFRSMNVTDGTAVTEWTLGSSRVMLNDSNNLNIGWLDILFDLNGKQFTRLYNRRVINGTTKFNGFMIGLDANGNPIATFSDNAAAAAFRNALGFSNTFTTTVSQVISAASGFTISQASYVQNGQMGQWYVAVKNTNAMSANAQYTIGTIVSGKRPATWSPVSFGYTTNTYGNGRMVAGGGVLVRPSASIAAGTTFYLLCPAYILG